MIPIGNRFSAFQAALKCGIREGAAYWYLLRVIDARHEEFLRIWSVAEAIPGWMLKLNAAVLYQVMLSRRPRTVVEVGSYLGRSSIFFGLAMKSLSPGGRVVAVDPHTGDRQQLEILNTSTLPSLDLFLHHISATAMEDVVEPVVKTSIHAAADWKGSIDLLYLDGWHSFDAVVADVQAWLPHLAPDGIIVFDDYLEYAEVFDAVNLLAAQGALYFWGQAFGHAFAGKGSNPPAGLDLSLKLMQQRLARRLYREPLRAHERDRETIQG